MNFLFASVQDSIRSLLPRWDLFAAVGAPLRLEYCNSKSPGTLPSQQNWRPVPLPDVVKTAHSMPWRWRFLLWAPELTLAHWWQSQLVRWQAQVLSPQGQVWSQDERQQWQDFFRASCQSDEQDELQVVLVAFADGAWYHLGPPAIFPHRVSK